MENENINNENQKNNEKQEVNKKPSKAYAICAIIFGILGGWLSCYFAVYGLKWLYKGPEYKKERVMCYTGLGLFLVWIVLLIVFACL